MFKTLYRCPRTVARHENGPLHGSRRRYLEHLAAQGAALHTLRAASGVIYRAAIWMNLDESSPVERKEVERAAERWANRSYRNASCSGPQQTDKEFRQTTCNWLRFAGRLRESDRVPAPHQLEIDSLCRYMEEERGLSPATIATARHSLAKFFKYARKRKLGEFRIIDVENFLARLGKEGWTRHGIRSIAHQIRTFFRYSEQQDWTKPSHCRSSTWSARIPARTTPSRSFLAGRATTVSQYTNRSQDRHSRPTYTPVACGLWDARQ